MQLNKRIAGNREENLQIGFLILIILPVLFLFYFNHPTTEDFYWGEIVKKAGFIDGQRFFLKYWGGRFTYYILMSLNPLFFNSIPAYNILLFLIMVSSVIILYLFISQFTGNSLTFKDKLFFTLSIFFLYLYAMPSIGQGLFCLGFIICYHLGIMLMLLFFIIYNRQIYTGNEKTKILYSIICCFVAIAIAGLNELSATIFLISIVLLLTKNLFVNKKINWSLVIFVIVTIIAVYIAFTSAGNSQRSKQYTDAHQLFYSVYNSGIFLLQQVVSWTINSPLAA
ncbi:MAG: hypothetical protein ABI840_05135, partial [bacterium]